MRFVPTPGRARGQGDPPPVPSTRARPAMARNAARARRRFLRFFPDGFRDATYVGWERDYKVETHRRWQIALADHEFERLLRTGQYSEVAARALRVEQQSRHGML